MKRMKCKFDTECGCAALVCYSIEKCESRDEKGNPMYIPILKDETPSN